MSRQITTISGKIFEPEFRVTKNGNSYLKLTVPVQVPVGRDPQTKEYMRDTYYYNLLFWNNLAKEYHERNMFVKGQYITVTGSVKIGTYQRQDGTAGINLEFVPGFELDMGMRPADAAQILPRSGQSGQGGQNSQNGLDEQQFDVADDYPYDPEAEAQPMNADTNYYSNSQYQQPQPQYQQSQQPQQGRNANGNYQHQSQQRGGRPPQQRN